MTGLVIYIFALLLTFGCAIKAAIHDWQGLTIPNILSAIIAALFIMTYAVVTFSGTGQAFMPLMSHLTVMGGVFAATFILYLLGLFGAGDVKLASALSLWVGLSGLTAFLFYTTFFGGVLGVMALRLRKLDKVPAWLDNGWIATLRGGKNAVPYGVAIAIGFIIAVGYNGALSPTTLQSFVG